MPTAATMKVGKLTLPLKQFAAWSYSRYHDYDQCPLRACLKHLQKFTTPEMIANEKARATQTTEDPLQRGDRIAKAAASFLTKKGKAPVPIDLMPVAKEYRELRATKNLSVEQSWGFTKDWKPCSPTDWNNCWLRIQIDVCRIEETKVGDILHITDNKTGKFDDRRNEEYTEQLELYGAGGMARMPTVTKATARLLYSDLGVTFPSGPPMSWTMKELEGLKKLWGKRVKPMFNDTRFNPKPGFYCRWCDFAKDKGGPCRY